MSILQSANPEVQMLIQGKAVTYYLVLVEGQDFDADVFFPKGENGV